MPRLPTMRVIGSHAISTMPLASFVFVGMALPPLALEAGHELGPRNSPLWFVVERLGGDAAQPSDRGSVHTACHRRDARARRLVHERHELVGEAGPRAADADPT